MNYYNFVNTILETAKSHKLVYEVGEGDIYEHLNSGDHKYPCVFLTVQNVDSNGSQMTVTGSLFYVDALLSDTSNKLQIQSTGMTTLQQIFMRLMDNYPDFDLRTGRYTPFDEKFSDLCAGVFSNFTISFMDDTCIFNDDIFEGDEPITPEPEGKYMTITVDNGEEGTVIAPTVKGSLPNLNLQYRINNCDWIDFIVGTTADIHVVAGDVVNFKGLNPDGISNYTKYPANYLNFVISGNPVSLSGNVMSLIDGVGDTLVIPNDYCFYNLFNKSNIKTVSKDFLPATTLASNCYENMFNSCTSLVQAPELPATTLAYSCYNSMFRGCTSLVQAPALPATVLASNCYNSMFRGCTSLVNALELPATTLASICYRYMFNDCTSLVQAPALPATALADDCYSYMFYGCTSLATAPELPATTLANGCYDYMFSGCTSLTTAPELPATTLANGCYANMFNGCTSLVNAPALPAETLADACYAAMFGECTSLTTAPALPATTLAQSCYEKMFHVCTSLTKAPELPATTLANRCYYYMFLGCSSLVNAPELPATKLSTYCYYRMFDGCTSLVNAPSLPATKLSTYCYYRMFDGCTSLATAPELPATVLANNCYQYMFYDCSSLTTAPVLPATTLANSCYSGMFDGCTSLATAPELPATTLSSKCYQGMFFGCTALTKAPELPATTLVSDCYYNMFNGCTALTKAPVLNATTLAVNCYNGMFFRCTALTTAPELPATKLVDNCYAYMFKNCNNLNYVKCLATDITATNALTDWLSGVSSTGTFVKVYGVEYLTNSPSGIPQGWTVEEIDAPIPPEPEGKYMTITVDNSAGSTTISPTVTGSLPNLNLQYRINNGDWTDFIVGTTAAIKVVAGDFVQWKGNNPAGVSTSYNDYLTFAISGNTVSLSGNIMSLIDGVGETLVIPNKLCFYYLFYTSAIKTVSSDFLPATTLKEECYKSLFAYCSNLTQAPALPATTLESFCYSEMFGGCSALKQAPELPATNLVVNCYNYMFIYCSSLNYVKCSATDNISTSTILGWLSGVSSTGTFVKPAGVSYETGDSGIPEGWTIQNI